MNYTRNVVGKFTTSVPGEAEINGIPMVEVVDDSETAPAVIIDTPESFVGQSNPRVIQRLIDEVDRLIGLP